MTKQEARDLETLCDALIQKALDDDTAHMSMNLTGRLKVVFGNGYDGMSIDRDFSRITYVSWSGDLDDLLDYRDKFLKCVNDRKDLFKKLKWSYEHIDELED